MDDFFDFAYKFRIFTPLCPAHLFIHYRQCHNVQMVVVNRSAGYACHLHGGKETAFISPVYEQRADVSAPVRNITDGTAAGFRFLQFGMNSPKTVTLIAAADEEARVSVRLDTAGGKEIASLAVGKGRTESTARLNCGVTGRHAVYFVFRTGEGKAEFDRFTFDD